MGSIAEISEKHCGRSFDSLAAYKDEFFGTFHELESKVSLLSLAASWKADTIEDWIEIRSRLEIMSINLERKIIVKAVS